MQLINSAIPCDWVLELKSIGESVCVCMCVCSEAEIFITSFFTQ